MGPLGTLLSLPVSGPMAGLTWIARQIANAAMQQLLDPTRIETALLVLERRLEDGQIDEATFEAEEERLLEELAEITALRAAQANEAGAEGAGADDEEEIELPLPPVVPVSGPPSLVDPGPLAGVELGGEGGTGAVPMSSDPESAGPESAGPGPDSQEVDAWTLA